jgi:hypothetical protein
MGFQIFAPDRPSGSCHASTPRSGKLIELIIHEGNGWCLPEAVVSQLVLKNKS